MTILYEFTIIYFTMNLHESTSTYINRDLCLETVARFMDYQYNCSFDFSTAKDILQDGQYIIWDDADACFIKEGQCVRIYSCCICYCLPGYILEDKKCLKRNLELNDSCVVTGQCIQPFSVCLNGKCQCMNGYSAFDTDSCLKDTVPVGGFCYLDIQCTGSPNSGTCENGRCSCSKGFTFIDLACEKDHQNSFGSSNCQQYDTHIGGTLGALFGGLILGVIVTAIVTTLVYRRLTFRTRNSEEPDVMSAENRACGASKISYTNNKKQKVAKSSPNSFSEETPAYNTLQPTSLSLEEGHYSTLGQ